jgi:hypothetical protein
MTVWHQPDKRWVSPLELLQGRALPVAEWDMATRNVKRLVEDLSRSGEVVVTHDLAWLASAYSAMGWNLARGLDSRWWPHDSRPDRSLIVAMRRGEQLLATSVARWMWVDGSLREMHQDGRFFYGDYAGSLRQRAECRVTSAVADHIAHCPIVYSCGLHAEKGLNQHDSWRMLRLSVLLAAINWHWSWVVARTGEGLARRYNERGWGFSISEPGIFVRREDGAREQQYHLVAGRIDHMRMQFQRDDYGDGASLGVDTLPLFLAEARNG